MDWIPVIKTALELGFGAMSFLAILVAVGWYLWKLNPIMNSMLITSQQLVESVKELKQDSKTQHDLLVEHSTVGDRVIEVVLGHGQKIEAAQGCLTQVKNEIAGMREFCRNRKG
jgi:hypothetical protein